MVEEKESTQNSNIPEDLNTDTNLFESDKPSVLPELRDSESLNLKSPPEKALVFVFGIFLFFAGAVIVFTRLFSGTNQAAEVPLLSPPVKQDVQYEIYTNSMYNFSFSYPEKWEIETLPESPDGKIALHLSTRNSTCFAKDAFCPILIEIIDNPTSKHASQLGLSFYPDQQDIFGGVGAVSVDDVNSTVIFNVYNTGGQMVFIPRSGYIIKLTLQNDVKVSMEHLLMFEEDILSTFRFVM